MLGQRASTDGLELLRPKKQAIANCTPNTKSPSSADSVLLKTAQAAYANDENAAAGFSSNGSTPGSAGAHCEQACRWVCLLLNMHVSKMHSSAIVAAISDPR